MLRLLLPTLLCSNICGGEIVLRVTPESAPQADRHSLDEAFEQLRRNRAMGQTEPATVLLAAGDHVARTVIDPSVVGEGLRLAPADPDAVPPTITAGVPVETWKVVDGIWTASLEHEPASLFIDGQSCVRAREPDGDYWRIEATGPDRRTSFTWHEGTVPEVRDLAHLDLVFLHDWSITCVAVQSLEHASRTLTTALPIGPKADHYRIDHFEPQPRFFLEGSRDFLDAPGEWHYDRPSKTLRYLPRPGEDPATAPARATSRPHALVLRGSADAPVKNLRIEGITFAHAQWLPQDRRYAGGQASFHEEGASFVRSAVPCAVEADFCENLSFDRCQFVNSSGGGLWIREGCADVSITNARFHNLGANGLMIGIPGDSPAITRKVTVADSRISDCGQRFFGSVGLWIGIAADCTVRNNEIAQLPYTGISLGWRWNPTPSPCRGHLIENNHIHHVLLTLSDGGGIYTLGRQPGSILRGNRIHDVRVNAGRAESNGIFMDEGTTDFVVEDNDIHDIARSPIRFHRAGKNLLRGNKLRPADGIPPLRFNSTPEENITVESPR